MQSDTYVVEVDRVVIRRRLMRFKADSPTHAAEIALSISADDTTRMSDADNFFDDPLRKRDPRDEIDMGWSDVLTGEPCEHRIHKIFRLGFSGGLVEVQEFAVEANRKTPEPLKVVQKRKDNPGG